MKTAERSILAFKRGIPDRVPIHSWLGLPLIRELKPKDKSMYDMLQWWIEDPMGSIVKMQADLGMDPMIWTHSQHIGESEIWPRMLRRFSSVSISGSLVLNLIFMRSIALFRSLNLRTRWRMNSRMACSTLP